MKQTSTDTKLTTPFFARKVTDAPLVVRTNVRAGATEAACKSDNPKDCK